MKRLALILALAISLIFSYSCTEDETVKKVESVSINKSNLTLTVGDSFTLKAVVKPSDADNKNISWKSSNAGVASVNTDGNVTAISVGSATITVTTDDGAKSATCEVTVKEKTYNVEGVTLDQETITLTEGETAMLTATITPENATNKAVIWSTSDETIATVSEGTITAISAGTATITVTTEDGEKTASCEVTVNEKIYNVEGVTLDQETITLTEGETATLTATITPENATNKAVIWSTSDETVATVSEGTITAISAGTATITVTTEDGAKSATCEVTVESAILKDVESVNDLTYTLNTPADEFYVSWSAVQNASDYQCWYVIEGDTYETPAEAIDNGDGTWSAKSSTAMGAATYTFYVIPIPIEGHALKNEEPSSIDIVLPNFENTFFSYRFMSDNVEEGIEYETACYDLYVKYKNIQFLKSDKTKPISDNWYIYTTTPVDNMHHLKIWYSLNYDIDEQGIKVYSSTEPGVKGVQLTPDGSIQSGKWRVYYTIPEGHKYLYIEGTSEKQYLLWTSFTIYHQ